MAKYITPEGLQAVLELIKADVKTVDDKVAAITVPSIDGLASEEFVNQKISAVLGADDLAEDLDSLKEVIDLLTKDGADILALQQAINKKVDAEDGKGLISLDEITRLADVGNYDDTAVKGRLDALEAVDHSQYLTEHQDISGLATKEEVQAKADATALDAKVDKVEGKSLIDDTEIARLVDVKNYDDTEIKGLITTKADKEHTHAASEIKFADETTLQAKLDDGSLKGEPGEKGDAFTYADFTEEQLASLKGADGNPGAKGDPGDDGVGIDTVTIEYVDNVPHVKVKYDDVDATVQDAGALDLTQIKEYADLKKLVSKLESQLNSTCPFGDCVWIDAEYKQTEMGAYIASPKMYEEMEKEPEIMGERIDAGAYELYCVARSEAKNYDRYYDTMIPMVGSSQKLGAGLAEAFGGTLPSWLTAVEQGWTFTGTEGKEIELNSSTSTPCIFVMVRRV